MTVVDTSFCQIMMWGDAISVKRLSVQHVPESVTSAGKHFVESVSSNAKSVRCGFVRRVSRKTTSRFSVPFVGNHSAPSGGTSGFLGVFVFIV